MELQPILDALATFAAQVLVIVLPVLASLAAAWLVAQIKMKIEQIKDIKYGGVGYALESAVNMAVSAAEQTFKGGEGKAKAKKDAAVALATAYLKARGVKLDVALIEGAVEAAVFDELTKFKEKKEE